MMQFLFLIFYGAYLLRIEINIIFLYREILKFSSFRTHITIFVFPYFNLEILIRLWNTS